MHICHILSSYLIYGICIILLLNPSFTYNVIKLTSCQIPLLYNLFTYSSINFSSDLTLWLIVAIEWNASLLFLSLSLLSLSLSVCWHFARIGNAVPTISFIPQAAPWWPQQVMLILTFLSFSISLCDCLPFHPFLRCAQLFIFFFFCMSLQSFLNHCR